ncbi:unnamed protein product, partial [Urochloa humidicola]
CLSSHELLVAVVVHGASAPRRVPHRFFRSRNAIRQVSIYLKIWLCVPPTQLWSHLLLVVCSVLLKLY